MKHPYVQLALLALLSTIGVAGLLLGDGAWTWPLLALAALPLPVGGLAILFRQAYLGYCDICDQYSAEI